MHVCSMQFIKKGDSVCMLPTTGLSRIYCVEFVERFIIQSMQSILFVFIDVYPRAQ